MKKHIAVIFLSSLLTQLSLAADFSFRGQLSNDDEFLLFNFAVDETSDVTLITHSYAGGVNSRGEIIPQGGFDPILSLFDSAGVLIDNNDDGSCSEVPVDSVTGECYDTFLTARLDPGEYTVSITQYDNFPRGENLSDGFLGANTTGFVDVTGNTRTSSWAFDVLNVRSANNDTTNFVSNPTGVWYEPERPGDGFNFVKTNAGLFFYFYGYKASNASEPLWLLSGAGPKNIRKGTSYTMDVFSSYANNGGRFGAPPVASDNGISPWGTATVTFNDCNTAQVTLTGTDGTASFNLDRLASVEGLRCSD
ncbi:DVUA0089 family protein [Ostreibacterium oceani]|uniref:Uncharacterized protein n=1 Tax=Ostreibacterium oceani TaxID=2654998 RepID=A0A6N7EY24_9GAMM|nr:DVUA0089 family protein [Ostreibacterium oceani]MPV86027.1 hypothetical protein [Ostreibacterium oceani]